VIEKTLLAAAAAVYVHHDGVIAKLQLGDLGVIAGMHRRAVRGYGAFQQFLIQGLIRILQKALFAGGQRLGSLSEFTGNVANQVEFRALLELVFVWPCRCSSLSLRVFSRKGRKERYLTVGEIGFARGVRIAEARDARKVRVGKEQQAGANDRDGERVRHKSPGVARLLYSTTLAA
jgi:hypothetical protein